MYPMEKQDKIDLLRRQIRELESDREEWGRSLAEQERELETLRRMAAPDTGVGNRIRTLEVECDSLRNEYARIETTLALKRRQLEQYLAQDRGEAEALAQRIQSMSVEEMARLSLEDIDRLGAHIWSDAGEDRGEESPACSGGTRLHPRHRKFKDALLKAGQQDAAHLTFEEGELLLSVWLQLREKLADASPVQRRLYELLCPVIEILRTRYRRGLEKLEEETSRH